MACVNCNGEITIAEARREESLYYDEYNTMLAISVEFPTVFEGYIQEQDEVAQAYHSMTKQEQDDSMMKICYC